MRPFHHPEEDDFVPELSRSIHPRERPDWEETLSAMARSAEIPELPGEPPLRSCASTASMKVKNIKKLSFTKGHFPKLAECAHFHYENVDFGAIQVSVFLHTINLIFVFVLNVYCHGRSWIVKRSYEDFRVLDKHLHLCIYDRRFSQLTELPRLDCLRDRAEAVSQMLMAYLSRLSAIADNKINCGPALTWMEVSHLFYYEDFSLPLYIVSVIDMPPKEDTTWWRGKHGFQVKRLFSYFSLFPTVSKKHGKLITFLRTFMKSRPTKQKLKQRGILRERVFGCDLGEHLLNSGHDIPQVLKSCTEFIEKYGVVDGIYRLSGIASNIQKLRHEFDSEQIPDLTKDLYLQDIHCVGSLCKLYFRELPNPLLTYQLYEKFSDAVSAATDEERLVKIHDVIQQLPPPHYRTLEFLMRHLAHLAAFSYVTNMHTKNLAIVWAPNLLRSKQIESACFSGTAAFMEVRIQSVVVEFILNHVDVLFSPKLSSLIREGAGHGSLSRPKSLLVSSPSTKLLTLEEAQARTQAQINSPITADSKYIEVGEGPAALQGKFHTVIEFPTERKRPPGKVKKSPVGSWRSFFNLGKSSSMAKRKLHRNPSEPNEMKAMALAGGRGETGTLRSAKSEESLTSLHNVDGESKVYRPRRPRSSSDALSASFNGDLLDGRHHCNSYDNVPLNDDGDEAAIRVPALISSPRSAEEMDLSPPDIGMALLDFDPMSFQCSPPQPEPELPSPVTAEPVDTQKSPGSASSSEPVSPSPEKFTSPFFSPDLSPAIEDRANAKHATFAEKVVQALSPKIGRKSAKSPPLTISDPVAISVPTRVSEIIGGLSTSPPAQSKPILVNSGASGRSPPQMISMLLKTAELELSESCQHEIYSKISTTQGLENIGPSGEGADFSSCGAVMVPSATQSAQGVTALDSPQVPVPVSSVSILPPPPPPKNAARMLALALAESAQQAAIQSQRKLPELPSAPATPPRHFEQPEAHSRPQLPKVQGPPPDPGSRLIMAGSPPGLFTASSAGTATLASVSQSMSMSHIVSTMQAATLVSSHAVYSTVLTPGQRDTVSSSTPSGQYAVATSPPPSTQQVPTSNITWLDKPVFSQNLLVLLLQVWHGGAPTQPLVKPVEQPGVPSSLHQASSSARPAAPSHPAEKPRETIKAPSHHPRAESVPVFQPYGPTPPTPPIRTMESKLAAAALSGTEAANASSFHSLLAGASLPTSIEETLPPPPPPPKTSGQQAYLHHLKSDTVPESGGETYYHPRAMPAGQTSVPFHYRPESVPPHLSYTSKPEPQPIYSARFDNRYSTLGPKSTHHSSKSRGLLRTEYSSMGPSGLHSQGYSAADTAAMYPTLRRVHSLHVPSTAFRSVPITRTEVPPDDELFYYQRPLYQYKPYQPPSQSDYHVTQLQPYFENGRVHYRYSPFSGTNPLDAPYYDVDPYGTIRLRHVHSFSGREQPHLSRAISKGSAYQYLSRQGLLPGKEHSFVSRDMPPSPDVKGTTVYLPWDPDDSEKLRMQSIRRENRTRQKTKGPVMSQYDNVGPLLQGDLSSVEVVHLRSKSDPGKTILMTSEGKDLRFGPSVPAVPPRHLPSDSDVFTYIDPLERQYQGNGLTDKTGLPLKPSGSRNPAHSMQGQPLARFHMQQQDPKNGPGEYEQPHTINSRQMVRIKTTSSYPEEDLHVATGKSAPPPKPERSHSIRGSTQQHYHHASNLPPHLSETLDRDPGSQYPYPHGKRHSTMTVLSQYDNLDDYHPVVPQAPSSMPTRGGSGVSSFTNPLNNRNYSTALGQGAFLQNELSMQRPEAEIHVE
uniref:Rho GTPase activating protein 32 n=1 Tax=Erpetoichthys calabaricus TaxID=27687 RepID=A0A8C4TAR0_ERPCA